MSDAIPPGPVEVDVRGLVCPEPVVRTRTALGQARGRPIVVVTDSSTSRDNIVRFAERSGCQVSTTERESGVWTVTVEPTGTKPCAVAGSGAVLLISSDKLGQGDEKLGQLLMTLFLRTLAEVPNRPSCLLLMNRGVWLALEGSQDLALLAALEAQGVTVRVCGTCLDFYGVKDRVRVGAVSNMYELVELLLAGDRTIVF
ncbi:sulfurtransferase-like selenium metabolism protein YedF [candidate division WOR-3 bacterium]|nr:sulfurtransferase-like selenium metabolism protein YedF [candidate division WOR-3 bacterium]